MGNVVNNLRHILAERYKSYLSNKGKVRVSEHIIVFESDDWGTVRTHSKDALTYLDAKFSPANDYFIKYDSLESKDDVSLLLNVLKKHKDKNGKYPVFTLNFGLKSPNFDSLINSNFDEIKYLDLKETYAINHKQDALEMLLEGIKKGLFVPQLHAINHINTDEWFKSIKENEIHQEICKQRCIDHSTISNSKFSFMDECRDFNNEELNTYLRDGNDLFESVFGFKSTSFIPCCNVLPLVDNSVFKNNGITTLQGESCYYFKDRNGNYKKRKRVWGKQKGITNLVRNCRFEPSINPRNFDVVKDAILQIKRAFRKGKPAIISTHRLNYIGSIDPKNRDNNLKLLDNLLTQIEKEFKDIIYMSSDKLGEKING